MNVSVIQICISQNNTMSNGTQGKPSGPDHGPPGPRGLGLFVFSWLVSRGVNCGRTQNGWTDRDAAWQKFSKTANFLSRNFEAQSGPSPTLYIFVVPGGPGLYRGPGPEASASPASWIIRF